MATFEGQSTDAENSRPLLKVQKPGDDTKSKSLGTIQSIARSVPPSENVQGGSGGGDAVVAPEQS